MRRRIIGAAAILAGSVLTAAVAAQAEDLKSLTTIGNDALREIRGAAMVNQAAGDGNLQANAAAIALNGAGKAIGRTLVVQRTESHDDDFEANAAFDAIAQISGRAFSGAQGIVAVSQGVGRNNLQANMITAALGVEGEVVVEAELGQSRADPLSAEPVESDGARFAHVAAGAFRDAQGVIQVNQVAGQGNNTFNHFALGISSGVAP